MKRLVWLLALAPLVPLACSSGDNAADGGADSGHDATTADVRDAASEAAADAPKDVAIDKASDALADTSTSDAGLDASDAGLDASDADAGGSAWHTPTCDGTIGASEYGNTSYQTTSGTQTWYITWDATNLYVALDVANLGEASVLYLGFSGNGINGAQVYDSTGGTLPFLADGVVYAKTGYQESRIASGDAGTWGSPNTGTVTFCGNGTTREEVIPWSALGASGIPASFRFLAYATSNAGSVYGQIPTSNPGGTIGTNATFGHDFFVSSTSNGSGAFPFGTVE